MPEHRSASAAPLPWRVAVAIEDIAETGQRFDLVADAEVRAAVAQIAGLRALPRLQANFDVTRHGAAGLRVAGKVSATVGQACVITLEPLTNEIAEHVDLVFAPPTAATASRKAEAPDKTWDDVEPLIGGSVDLGALAVEFLILGLDPYPRKPGAVFKPLPDATPKRGPFAALAALKKDSNDR